MAAKVKPLSLEPDTESSIKEFNLQVATAAEDVIFRKFPEKILSLQQLIEEMSSPASDYNRANLSTDVTVYPPPSHHDNTQPEPSSKKRRIDVIANGDSKSPSGSEGVGPSPGGAVYPQLVRMNEHVRRVQQRNKAEFEDMVQLCDKVKLWINLTMPRIEDGDNFGVQIQEEVLNELSRAQESAYSLRDAARSHHLVRAKLCAKLIKYPNVEDYVIAVQDHDEKQLFMARQHMFDVRNVYAILFDILTKNIQKIRAPKGNNSIGMY
ncbi:proteasome activator pa28, REG alpha/beta subunit [Clavulina sp. PMI_390]|nr:proteasome activator pa28, REG alpha/beta subunit [Clavulina sp. PMI_390]